MRMSQSLRIISGLIVAETSDDRNLAFVIPGRCEASNPE
jgi:hypothetical protein